MRDGTSRRCKNEYSEDDRYAYLTIIRKNGDRVKATIDKDALDTISKYHWQYTKVSI